MRSKLKLQQMKDMLPNIKVIMLLRSPTDRAYSGFEHNCRHKRYHRLLRSIPETGALGQQGTVIYGEVRDGYVFLFIRGFLLYLRVLVYGCVTVS